MRDPSIFRNTDGLYYLTYTTGGGANIGFARSSDRINWTPLGNYPVPFLLRLDARYREMAPVLRAPRASRVRLVFSDGPSLSPFVTKAWAPEWFVDGDRVNVILSMSTGGGFVPYLMTALEPSLRLWSPACSARRDRCGPHRHHRGQSRIDLSCVHQERGRGRSSSTRFAPSVTGPYSFVPPGNWGSLVEGPAVVQLPSGRLADLSRRLYRRKVSLLRQHGRAEHLVSCARGSWGVRDCTASRHHERTGITFDPELIGL